MDKNDQKRIKKLKLEAINLAYKFGFVDENLFEYKNYFNSDQFPSDVERLKSKSKTQEQFNDEVGNLVISKIKEARDQLAHENKLHRKLIDQKIISKL